VGSALCIRARAAAPPPPHVKELVALAIAVSKECDGCIAYHARGAALQGATREELAEVLAVALLMNGGPATVYGPRAWAAFDEFAPKAEGS
jgi:AhpD family alkylhydroperoxidase